MFLVFIVVIVIFVYFVIDSIRKLLDKTSYSLNTDLMSDTSLKTYP